MGSSLYIKGHQSPVLQFAAKTSSNPLHNRPFVCIADMKQRIGLNLAWMAVTSALSLPPLIPSIPGVTEPLASNAPPLPILQVPTPPIDSPPFTPSNIQPKKIGYFWTGAGDNEHKGKLDRDCH